jgi:hypothetical protein
MSSEQRLRAIWKSPRFWLLIIIIFAIPLLADFNARLAYVRQMTAESTQLTEQINHEKTLRTELLALRDFVQSNDFVEHWARQAGLARPGETVVKPSPVETAPAITNTTSLPTPIPNAPHDEWVALFLGPR